MRGRFGDVAAAMDSVHIHDEVQFHVVAADHLRCRYRVGDGEQAPAGPQCAGDAGHSRAPIDKFTQALTATIGPALMENLQKECLLEFDRTL